MPGSLLSRSRVARHESTRSDRSDASAYSNASQNSAKKVSFNKSVRVKKYPKTKRSLFGNGDISSNGAGHMNGLSNEHPSTSPEKRFWFKVYKNRHRQAPDPKEFQSDVIYYGPTSNSYDDVSYHPNPSSSVHYSLPSFTSESGTQTPGKYSGESQNQTAPLHPSQMPTEPPTVRRNHVKKIVNRFNEEAVLQRQRSPDGDRSPPKSPPTSPRTYPAATPQEIPPPPPEPPTTERNAFSKFKKSPIVNGVKVIFGMAPLKKKDKVNHTHETNTEDTRVKKDVNGDIKNRSGFYKSLRSDESDLEDRDEGYSTTNRKSSEVVRSGDKFIVPTEKEGEKDSYYFNGYYDDYYDDDENENRRNKIHVETWDSGNQLLFDTSDVNAFSEKTEGGEFLKTVGEKHQLWRNNKRIIVYEEPPSPPTKPSRRKAKSQNDLSIHEDQFISEKSHFDRVKSSEELSKDDSVRKEKDSTMKQWKTTTKDKGVQCSKVPKTDKNWSSDDVSSGKYKIIRPRNGVVSAYSHVPSLEKSTCTKEDKIPSSQIDGLTTNSPSADRRSGSAIYSQVDKSKKKKGGFKKINEVPGGLFKCRSEPLYIGPPPKNPPQETETDDFHTSIYYENNPERKIKTSKRSFGFHLKSSKESPDDRNRVSKDDYREENWYDVDDDVKAVELQKRRGADHHDISEVRQELAEDEEEGLSDDISSLNNGRGDVAASVMREVDYKKREISYENVYRPEGDTTNHHHPEDDVGSGLWYRDADEDYRKEMAQSEVSYPAGNHVGSDRFYTLGRSENASKRTVSMPSPRAYTLDRRHLKEKHKKVPNTSGVKILVNGKEVGEKGTIKKTKGHRKGKISAEDPSSVQSDPMYVRGGLAAAYQARQRAAVRRSNSSITGNVYRSSPSRLSPNIPRRGHASSEASGASSESESARLRRPLVMYIPGISHPEKEAEEGDRNSSVNVARSQSMMTTTRPPRIIPKSSGARRSHRNSKHKTEDIFEEEDDEVMPLARESKRKSGHKKQSDIRRRHSMPKDTKFSWLKWRIKGKPSREP